ncbi:hypothetical protein LCGC14_1620240 [marine sediment metagenome]|uniref:Uncharacterized protein n=1 Tax=marine sediment metagenome TaxID=412755 RepID=A0A0F9L5M8_9ZZZZ
MKFEDDENETYDEFWKDIIGPEDNLNFKQIKKELHDYAVLMDNAGKVYDYVSGGRISKVNTYPSELYKAFDDTVTEAVEDAILEHEDYLKQWVNVKVGPNTIFVFCFDEDTPKSERVKFQRTWEKAKKKFPTGVSCLMVPKNIDLTRILEEELNQLGWYKR